MHVTEDEIRKLALKLIETFSWRDSRQRGFERYWPLAGPLETFCAHAVGPLEQDVAKAMQNALEAALRRTAPQSFNIDADSVAQFLAAEPLPDRPGRSKRPYARRRR